MENVRAPFQGVWNIIRFNRHFYGTAGVGLLMLCGIYIGTPVWMQLWCVAMGGVIVLPLSISLGVSYYIYDCSTLYTLDWIPIDRLPVQDTIVNINAGFDETSVLLQQKFPKSTLAVWDFYDPEHHTEVSIRRARKAYPPFPNTIQIATGQLPEKQNEIAIVFAILSAHEIRDSKERTLFFEELYRILRPNGRIIVTEHLRDTTNFLAYTLGFFHFYSKKTWQTTFQSAGLEVEEIIKITPFITTFILRKYGNTT